MSKLLHAAFTQVGITEVKGEQDNPEIVKYFNELGFDGSRLKDETAWCSAVLGYLCKKLHLPYSGRLNATSWLDVGVPVDNPVPGDIVIFWRGQSKGELIDGTNIQKGHVGIFINRRDEMIWVLGGNQSNSFTLSPYSEVRLLGYRRLEF